MVGVLIPGALQELAGGARRLDVEVPVDGTVGDVLVGLGVAHPALRRRLMDETGTVRAYVNVYVDGSDIRHGTGLATPVADGAVVHILASVAGG
ncbi:MAG TPA: ubiquitin-like small modifier protein 1 [Acidimicrobiales bacterium]|nr:ubiquitin-like small modifier protein 1 [Acidimicrobiales bacterium]